MSDDNSNKTIVIILSSSIIGPLIIIITLLFLVWLLKLQKILKNVYFGFLLIFLILGSFFGTFLSILFFDLIHKCPTCINDCNCAIGQTCVNGKCQNK